MREIEFRAYQPEAKGDLKWWSWQELRESDLNTIFRHPERYHLMQYTGLKDKNGVKIFEGDIVRHISIGRKSTYIVAWDVGSGAFHYKPTKGTGGYRMFVNGSGFAPYEIIGNIYDNPDLLEVD